MRKPFFTIIFALFFYVAASAQQVNGVLLKDIDVEYIEITERPVSLTNQRINLFINYGQYIKAIGNAEKLLLDSTGKKMEFNNLIEALNFMHKQGYELTEIYRAEGDRFLLRRRAQKPD